MIISIIIIIIPEAHRREGPALAGRGARRSLRGALLAIKNIE